MLIVVYKNTENLHAYKMLCRIYFRPASWPLHNYKIYIRETRVKCITLYHFQCTYDLELKYMSPHKRLAKSLGSIVTP